MLRAGALYFAIFISFIVSIMLGSVILYASYSNRYTDDQLMRDRVTDNASSGITLGLTDTALLIPGKGEYFDLFGEDDPSDKVFISKSVWGVYEILNATASWKDFSITKTVLAGSDPSSGEPVALYMADKDRYLSISGNTLLSGTCYLPRLGLRSAYIEGQSFRGGKLVNGEIKTSNTMLPALNNSVLSANMPYLSDTLPTGDSIVDFKEITGIDSIEQSFRSPTLVLASSDPVTLGRITLKGNIRVISSKAIYITEFANTEHILLYAPSIYFNMGFKGCLQAFAEDTLIAGEGCDFSYPSCLGIINRNINGIYVNIKKKTFLAGTVFIFQENKATNTPLLVIEDKASIHGQVYCPGSIELRGKIEGSLYCDAFILHTMAAYYDNHLLNVIIDRNALSEFYAGSVMVPGYSFYKAIQWLN